MSLLQQYVNMDDGKHERKVGRYYASEIGYIRKGYLTPKNYFDKKPIDEQGAMNILTGIAYEDMLEKMLVALKKPHQYNPKKEIKIDDFVLVVKPDFVFDNSILETKAPMKTLEEIPEKWKDQLCVEGIAFEKPVYLGVFGNNFFRRFSITTYKYEPEKGRWEDIKKILIAFHQELLKTYPHL